MRLATSWLVTRVIYTRMGKQHLWYRLKTKLLGQGLFSGSRKG